MPKNDVVIDANIFISALIGSQTNLKIIKSSTYRMYAPSKLIEELQRNKAMVCEKAGCTPYDFDNNLDALLKLVKIVEYEQYKNHLLKATEVLGPQHTADAHYLACALIIKASFIWTNDKNFSRQILIPAKSTRQVLIRIKIFKYLNHVISSKMRER